MAKQVLIIDNGTSYLEKLKGLLQPNEVIVTKYNGIPALPAEIDTVILSGGHEFPVVEHAGRLDAEINLVKNFPGKVIGICYGFELLAYMYGAKVLERTVKRQQFLGIEIANTELFHNLPNFQVYESHRWVVADPGANLEVLATSIDGIEAFKHKSKPHFGLQFHPEMFPDQTCGDEVFQTILS